MATASRFFFHSCGRRSASLTFLLLLAGCERNDIASYRLPKENDASPAVAVAPIASAGNMAGTPVATAAGPGLGWKAPASWRVKPLGAMRKGSYTVGGDAGATADLSITAFPGAVGGELANLNRWRGQLSLPPIDESDLAAAVTRLDANGLTFTLVELVSTAAVNPQRVLGAMVPYEGAMWFFKLSGPATLVATTKPAFLDFIKTVQPTAPVAP